MVSPIMMRPETQVLIKGGSPKSGEIVGGWALKRSKDGMVVLQKLQYPEQSGLLHP